MTVNSDVDISIVLERLGKKPNVLNLSQSIPPHTIIGWEGGDTQPSDEAINSEWTTYKSSSQYAEDQKL